MDTQILKSGCAKLKSQSAALAISAFMFLPSVTNAADEKPVPWTWKLKLDPGDDTTIQKSATLNGKHQDGGPLSGRYTIEHSVTEPTDEDPDDGLHWELQSVPGALVTLNASWFASVHNTTKGDDTSAKASVSLSGPFTTPFYPSEISVKASANEQISRHHSPFNFDNPMGDGATFSYGGSVDVQIKPGSPSGLPMELVTANSILSISADIKNPNVTAVYALVPEPATYALMLAGLGLVGFMARRKESAK